MYVESLRISIQPFDLRDERSERGCQFLVALPVIPVIGCDHVEQAVVVGLRSLLGVGDLLNDASLHFLDKLSVQLPVLLALHSELGEHVPLVLQNLVDDDLAAPDERGGVAHDNGDCDEGGGVHYSAGFGQGRHTLGWIAVLADALCFELAHGVWRARADLVVPVGVDDFGRRAVAGDPVSVVVDAYDLTVGSVLVRHCQLKADKMPCACAGERPPCALVLVMCAAARFVQSAAVIVGLKCQSNVNKFR